MTNETRHQFSTKPSSSRVRAETEQARINRAQRIDRFATPAAGSTDEARGRRQPHKKNKIESRVAGGIALALGVAVLAAATHSSDDHEPVNNVQRAIQERVIHNEAMDSKAAVDARAEALKEAQASETSRADAIARYQAQQTELHRPPGTDGQ